MARNEEISDPISYRPELPDWGVYLRWPLDGETWISAEDIAVARQLIPSRRVFKRFHWDGEYYHLSYGDHLVRVRPSLWTRVDQLDLAVGQQVELLHRHGENDPGVFRVHEILLSTCHERFEFYLLRDELVIEKAFTRDDLRPIHVSHNLRAGFYEHELPKSSKDGNSERLDVGDLLGDP